MIIRVSGSNENQITLSGSSIQETQKVTVNESEVVKSITIQGQSAPLTVVSTTDVIPQKVTINENGVITTQIQGQSAPLTVIPASSTGYARTAGTASLAVYSYTAESSSHALNADASVTSVSSSYSLTSSYAVSSSIATTVDSQFIPLTASYALTAGAQGGGLVGGGTSNYIAKFTLISELHESSLYDDGTFISSSVPITASAFYGDGSELTNILWTNLSNIPVGIVSSSSQINSGSFTGSFIGSASYALTSSYVENAISSSYAGTASYATNAGASTWEEIQNKPTGLVSSSVQVDYGQLQNIPIGLISSSAQINSGTFTGSFIGTSSYAITASYASNAGASTWDDIQNKPDGLVSSSVQVSYTQLQNVPVGLISSSAQLPAGIVSSSLQINTGSFSGSFVGTSSWSDYSVTASYAANAGASDWSDLLNKPVGLVSSSVQINSGSFTGSFIGSASWANNAGFAITAGTANAVDYTNIINKPTLLSSSAQVDYDGIQNVPSGIVSSSAQLPAGLVSSSAQINSGSFTGSFIGSASWADNAGYAITAGTAGVANAVDYSNVTNKPTLVSSSTQVDYTGLQNIPAGIVSSSVQINTGSFTGSFTGALSGSATTAITASYALTTSGFVESANTASYVIWNNIDQTPIGLVSSSAQVNSGSFTGSFIGSASWATAAGISLTANSVDFANVTSKPTLVSSSTQISYTEIQNVPIGIVSSSAQINSGTFTGSFVGSASWADNAGLAITAGTANSVAFTNITGKPTLVSSSAQVNSGSFTGSFIGSASWATNAGLALTANTASFATNVLWTNVNGKPIGLVSSSAQVNTGSFTGSFVGSASWATAAGTALAVDYARVTNKPTLVSSSAQINTGSFTGSFIGSASWATAAGTALAVDYARVTNKPTLVSSSAQVNSGSFTGSFIGSASWATNAGLAINANSASYASAVLWNNVGSKPVGLVSSSTQINTGSFTGSFTGSLLGSASYALTSSYARQASSSFNALSASWAPFDSTIPRSYTGSFSASSAGIAFYGTASYALQAAGVGGSAPDTAYYIVSGSNPALSNAFRADSTTAVTWSFAGGAVTLSVTSASYAISASYADNAGASTWDDIQNKPIGLVSSSVQVNSGSFTGSFIGSASWADNAGLAINANSASYASTVIWSNIGNIPQGLVSSSTQINTGSFTGSFIGSASWADAAGVALDVDYTRVSNKPTLVSSSTQVSTGSYTGSFTGDFIGTASQAITASYALTTSGFVESANTASYVTWTNVDQKPTGLVSSSTQVNSGSFTGSFIGSASWATAAGTALDVDYTRVSNKPALVSSSAQVNTGSFTGSFIGSASWATAAGTALTANSVAFVNITGKPTLVSSSAQVNSGSFTGSFIGSASWADNAGLALTANTASFATNVLWTNINGRPVGLVSSSAQVNTGSFTGSFIGSASWATNAGFAITAGTATTANAVDYTNVTNKPSLVSSSAQVNTGSFTGSFIGSASWATAAGTALSANAVAFADITGKPTLVSSSAQIDYTGIQNVPVGIVSSSTQINTGSFTGSFTGGFNSAPYTLDAQGLTSTAAANYRVAAAQGHYWWIGGVNYWYMTTTGIIPALNNSYTIGSTGLRPSTIFTTVLDATSITGSFTGSATGALLGSASYALTASYALNGGTGPGPGGSGQLLIPFKTDFGAEAIITAIAAGITEHDENSRIKVDLSSYTEARVAVRINSCSLAATELRVQYSDDNEVTWNYLDGATGAARSLGPTTGSVAGSWVTLAAGAKADVVLRWITSGGDGSTNVRLGSIALQVK